jgi:hypothetical protein
MASEENIKLITSEGETFETNEKITNQMVTVKNMIDDIGLEELSEGIPLPNINNDTLQKVIEFASQHQDEDASDDERVKLTEWDQEFFKMMDQESIFKIILAANYLDYELLLNSGCKIVANMIKGKTPEQIRQTFNIKNDFTPEEEEQVKKENEWLETAK